MYHKNVYRSLKNIYLYQIKTGNNLDIHQQEKRINKLCYTHMVEYYSETKRNKLQIDATTWINPKKLY